MSPGSAAAVSRSTTSAADVPNSGSAAPRRAVTSAMRTGAGTERVDTPSSHRRACSAAWSRASDSSCSIAGTDWTRARAPSRGSAGEDGDPGGVDPFGDEGARGPPLPQPGDERVEGGPVEAGGEPELDPQLGAGQAGVRIAPGGPGARPPRGPPAG